MKADWDIINPKLNELQVTYPRLQSSELLEAQQLCSLALRAARISSIKSRLLSWCWVVSAMGIPLFLFAATRTALMGWFDSALIGVVGGASVCVLLLWLVRTHAPLTDRIEGIEVERQNWELRISLIKQVRKMLDYRASKNRNKHS